MTPTKIQAWAREAGFSGKQAEVYFDRLLERFAALARADLEAENVRLKLHIKHIGNDALRSENAALKAEVESLRADAARGYYMIDTGCWNRGAERTYLSVAVPQGSDLSCYAMREAAIDAAMKGEQL